MKKIMNIKVLTVMVFCVGILIGLVACSDSDDGDGVKVYEYKEQLGKKVKELNDFFASVEFGGRKGMYPESSRAILEDGINTLKELITNINHKKINPSNIPDATSKAIADAKVAVESFKATVRTEDILLPAELHVVGENGGYIDFGVHPEYSNFGVSGQQQFTVDFWVKLDKLGDNFLFILSAYTESPGKRNGWFVNSHFGGVRISYAMEIDGLFEPGIGAEDFNMVNEWVHLAVVTNESGVDGETHSDGRPIMTKVYVNGELKRAEPVNELGKKYTPQPLDSAIPMFAFMRQTPEGGVDGGYWANGYMKYMHIWKSAKTGVEIKKIMGNPKTITGEESDLVCGWDFDFTVLDDKNIKDITGNFTAKLVGDFEWKIQE